MGDLFDRRTTKLAIYTTAVVLCTVLILNKTFQCKQRQTTTNYLNAQSSAVVRLSNDTVLLAKSARVLNGDDPGPFLGEGTIPLHLMNISITEAQRIFHRDMTDTPYKCTETERLGREGDGGYEICLRDPYKFKKNSCLVYSVGIRNDWSFDEAVNTKYGCEVHSFDPSIGKPDHVHRQNMYFHNLGVWGSNVERKNGWILKNLATIVKMLNHTDRVIDYIKVDAEGAEWTLMEHIISSGIHRQVKQIALEMHTPRTWKDRSMKLIDYAEIIHGFQKFHQVGFRKYLYHTRNNCCGRFVPLTPASMSNTKIALCCYELFFVNQIFQ